MMFCSVIGSLFHNLRAQALNAHLPNVLYFAYGIISICTLSFNLRSVQTPVFSQLL